MGRKRHNWKARVQTETEIDRSEEKKVSTVFYMHVHQKGLLTTYGHYFLLIICSKSLFVHPFLFYFFFVDVVPVFRAGVIHFIFTIVKNSACSTK